MLYAARSAIRNQRMSSTDGVNPDFRPTDDIETVLDIFKRGRDSGQPWGRLNPIYIRKETELGKSEVEYVLRRLADAGWVYRPVEGLYEFRTDPRE